MSQSPRLTKTSGQTTKRTGNPTLLIASTMLDTTWRMFIPIIGGTVGGVALDNTFATAPLFTILLIIIGTGLAALLIRNQFRNVRKDS